MKKIILFGIILSSHLLAYYPNESSAGETLIGDQTQVSTYINNPVSSFSNLNKNKASRTIGTDVIATGDVKMVNIPYVTRLSKNLALSINLPYIQTTGLSYNTGIGDASVGLSYLRDTNGSNDIQAAQLRIKLATGDYQSGLGTGANALFGSYTYTKTLGQYVAIATASLTWNDLFKVTSAGVTTTYGNVVSASLGASRVSFFSDKLITTARLSYYYAGEDKTDSSFVVYNNATTNIDIWLNWASDQLLAGIPINFGIKIPLYAKSNQALLSDKVFLFYINVTSFFKHQSSL